MSDLFLQLGKNPGARKIIKGLGLPVPMPTTLTRDSGPRTDKPLAGHTIIVSGSGDLIEVLGRELSRSGADPFVADESAKQRLSNGHPAKSFDLLRIPEAIKIDGCIFDASAVATPDELSGLYETFHAVVPKLARCGRIVVLGRKPADATTPSARAAQAALEGFVRSLAKEVGKYGSTANLIYASNGAQDRIGGPLRFLLTKRSAFVTGQAICVTNEEGDFEDAIVKPLDRKRALVTGAARGIGEETARRLAQEGAKVYCLDRPQDEELLRGVAAEVGGEAVAVDLSATDAPEKIGSALKEGVDIIVNNAGITRDKTLARMDRERWDQVMTVNLSALIRMTDHLVSDGLTDGGRIVCISSVAGIAGNVGQTNYAASKAGVIGYVHAQSALLEARGITVNAVAPGFIETRLTHAIPVMIREAGRRLSSLAQGGLPQDVAEAVTFLSTPGAGGINGQVLRVCGGAFIGK